MLRPKKKSSISINNKERPISRRTTEETGEKLMTIVIEAGKSDQVAFTEFMQSCLVPILAERFMSEQEKKK
jgi:hypothetical protein